MFPISRHVAQKKVLSLSFEVPLDTGKQGEPAHDAFRREGHLLEGSTKPNPRDLSAGMFLIKLFVSIYHIIS